MHFNKKIMKKIILIAALFAGTFAQAQITLNKQGGVINNGDVFTYTTLTESTAKLGFNISNDTDETVALKMRMDEILNAVAMENDVQFCFGECLYEVTAGQTVPSFNVELEANSSSLNPETGGTGNQDHFWNLNPGNGTDAVSYKMSLVKVDEEGVPTETVVQFTYRYDPTASITDFNSLKNMGLAVNNTVVKNVLDITATQNASLEIIDLNGKTVKKAAVTNGSQSIDLSGLSNAVYIARFVTENNQKAYIKIVKN
jgi:hypothetical protein